MPLLCGVTSGKPFPLWTCFVVVITATSARAHALCSTVLSFSWELCKVDCPFYRKQPRAEREKELPEVTEPIFNQQGLGPSQLGLVSKPVSLNYLVILDLSILGSCSPDT